MIEEWKVYKDTRRNGRKGSGGNNGMLYEISNLGRVRKNGVLFEPKPTNSGYLYFNHIYVHRAVAELFIPNPDNKLQVDHIDTNKLNNRVDNLRWVTQSENNRNPITHQKMKEYRATEETKQKLRGRVVTEEQRKRHSEFMKEYYKTHDAWNKGKKMPQELVDKVAEKNRGRTPWNKGLTKETDERLYKAGQKERITKISNKQK